MQRVSRGARTIEVFTCSEAFAATRPACEQGGWRVESLPLAISMVMVVERSVVRVAAREQVSQQVEDLFLVQRVQHAVGHDG